MNVYEASKERLAFIFDNFEKVYVSFSGGKDSGVLLHLACNYMKEHNIKKKLGVFFVDFEAQYQSTIDFAEKIFAEYEDLIEVAWLCLPIEMDNGNSVFEGLYKSWDPEKKDKWTRQPPERAHILCDEYYCDFWFPEISFREICYCWGQSYSEGKLTANLIGIRTDESYDRWRMINNSKRKRFMGKKWTAGQGNVKSCYPLYDWHVNDIWTANAKFNWSYNDVYDKMHKLGIPMHAMRISEVFGKEQKQGLDLIKKIEPETWGKIVERVAGANMGNIYCKTSMMGKGELILPEGYNWQKYSLYLLDGIPEETKRHYQEVIKNHTANWKTRGIDIENNLSDSLVDACWRRVASMLSKNDWAGKELSLTKAKKELSDKQNIKNKYEDLL